jgi:hypothetical protein|tara:strand:- start:1017 stop:1397 length:381 start_codon:yes stop_codon:yes gene_type:complete
MLKSLSCNEVAKILSNNNPSTKAYKDAYAYLQARAKASKRLRWARLLKAVVDGDTQRVAYRAAETAEERRKIASTLTKPKASAKPKTTAKAVAKKSEQVDALTKATQAMTDTQLAAFFEAIIASRK